MENKRIIFMGTPEFAVASLKALFEARKNIVGVITAPDKPKGRGKKLGQSPVKEYALAAGLNILQPTNLKHPDFQKELRSLDADLQVVVAFRMLPEAVWSMPPDGTFNLHASLLPQYRGAAPINWAIINGEKETGVTTFFLKHEIDTGSIIFQESEPIHPDDNVGDLYERLMLKGAKLVLRTVNEIEAGTVDPKPQEESQNIKSAPKIFKDDCRIDWNNSSDIIYNMVRGLSPYPAAWTILGGKILKLFEITKTKEKSIEAPGTVKSNGKDTIEVATGDRQIRITELQLEGKKRMPAQEFIRGYERLLQENMSGL